MSEFHTTIRQLATEGLSVDYDTFARAGKAVLLRKAPLAPKAKARYKLAVDAFFEKMEKTADGRTAPYEMLANASHALGMDGFERGTDNSETAWRGHIAAHSFKVNHSILAGVAQRIILENCIPPENEFTPQQRNDREQNQRFAQRLKTAFRLD